jgi:hypothetical protein
MYLLFLVDAPHEKDQRTDKRNHGRADCQPQVRVSTLRVGKVGELVELVDGEDRGRKSYDPGQNVYQALHDEPPAFSLSLNFKAKGKAANDTAQSSQENRLSETSITPQDGLSFIPVHVTATAHPKATL